MKFSRCLLCVTLIFLPTACTVAGQDPPPAAWSRGIGEPLINPGTKVSGEDIFDDGYWQGAPVGGFGAGTFSRTYRGDFARWHLKTGVHKYETVFSDQFSLFEQQEGEAGTAKVLFTGHPAGAALKSWKWDYPVGAGEYHALYPKAWYDYHQSKLPARLVVEQFSPVLPYNYKETSYPVAVYLWHASNPTKKNVTISVMLTWENMIGWLRDDTTDFKGQLNHGDRNQVRTENVRLGGANGRLTGIVFDRDRSGPVTEEWDGQMAIASVETQSAEVSYVSTFDPEGDGSSIWTPFSRDGRLPDLAPEWTSSGEPLAGAIAVRFQLRPGEKKTVPIVIAWDLPNVQFGGGRKWLRRYTDFFGSSGTNAWEIARTALENSESWSKAIDAWQAPYIQDETKPLWYRGMLFNEIYILADGGSFYGKPAGQLESSPAVFSYLDFDYLSYSPLDVLFYGSMPLVKFWPELDKNILRQFAATVPEEMPERNLWEWETVRRHQPVFRVRKVKGVVPHDLGNPREDPFYKLNQFTWQDSSRWKDLNSKYVLMVWRDYVLTGGKDVDFLQSSWPSAQQALEFLMQFDLDGDGLPENQGFPDSTYDDWTMKGTSAYCGGLYLAALRAAEEMGRVLGDTAVADRYHSKFVTAQSSYIRKLWNGQYFRFDTESEYRDNIQADQLAGQWYANLTGLGDVVPREMRRKALETIFDFNVKKFAGGTMGAVNGMTPDGRLIQTNDQVHEVWVGTTFAVASEMLAEGMREQAFKTAWGVYHTSYETKGYWFRTPEAWNLNGTFRASMYMRPGAIWSMELMPKPQ
jgi:non-lysosomal glucosylceramidase